jgi:hypothetical protein
MKALIIPGVCLLVGLAVGGYVGYHFHGRYVTGEAVKLMLEGGESSEAEQAARATRAIELIEAHETQKAVEMLSRPIAYYHFLYADHADTERRRQICAMIDQLASTNKTVAEAITNEMSYSQARRNGQ